MPADPWDGWTCHVCGAWRPDAMIRVHQRVEVVHGVRVVTNVRFCADRPRCVAGAPQVRFFRPAAPADEPFGGAWWYYLDHGVFNGVDAWG